MSDDSNRADVGLVLVHGIGDQAELTTLTEAADGIARWVTLACSDTSPDAPAATVAAAPDCFVDDAKDGADEAASDAPRHVLLTVTNNARQPDIPDTWLLAEAWWAKCFPEPSKGEMLSWLIRIAPSLLINHLAGRQEQIFAKWRETFWLEHVLLTITYALALPISMLALFSFGLLYALSAIPIKGIDEMARRAQRALSARLGDSHVFVSSPMRKALIKKRIREAIDWIEEKCDSVVLVAHSQGAAVTFEVLRDIADGSPASEPSPAAAEPERSEAPMFFSYGQGIAKLAGIDSMVRAGGASIGIAPLLVFILTVVWVGVGLQFFPADVWWQHPIVRILAFYLLIGWLSLVHWSVDSNSVKWALRAASVALVGAAVWLLPIWSGADTPCNVVSCLQSRAAAESTYYVVGYVLLFTLFMCGEWSGLDTKVDWGVIEGIARRFHWVDVHSTMDPVPNGPLTRLAPSRQPGTPASVPIVEWPVENRRSMMADHTTYWSNVEEFVTVLMSEATKFARAPRAGVATAQHAGRLVTVAREGRWRPRRERVRRLCTWRWSVIGTWLAVALSDLHALPPPLLAAFDWSEAIGMSPTSLLLLVLAFLLYGLYVIVSASWEIWNEMEVRDSFRDSGSPDRKGVAGARKVATFTEWALALMFLAASGWALATHMFLVP